MVSVSDLIRFTKDGIYCPKGDFWVDPSRVKQTAVITHAHSDHARRGHKEYICHYDTGSLLKLFYGEKIPVMALGYGDTIDLNGVSVTLFPSGHILGASQALIEHEGLRVVVAGDYKVENDMITPPFVAVPCDVFVTESTFAKPHYNWEPQAIVFEEINNWWRDNQKKGYVSILLAYSLGKSQRLLGNVDPTIGRIFVSDQVKGINDIYEKASVNLPVCNVITDKTTASELEGSLVIVSSTKSYEVLNNLPLKDIKRVSGWVEDSWFGMDGFPISDHADWKGLNDAIIATGAERIYVQHGFTSYFTRYLKTQGYDAYDTDILKKRDGEIELF
jgi:putative mRNA 3-end processing factor